MLNAEFNSFDEDMTVVGAPTFTIGGDGSYIESYDPLARDRSGFNVGWQMALNVLGSGNGNLSGYQRTGPDSSAQMTREILFVPTVSGNDQTPAQYNCPPIPSIGTGLFPLDTVVVVLGMDLLIPEFVTPANMGGTLEWKFIQAPFIWEVVRTNVAAPNNVFTVWDASINPAGPIVNDALFSANTFVNTGNILPGSSNQTHHSLRSSYFLGHPFYFRFTTAWANLFQLTGGDYTDIQYPNQPPILT